MELSYEILPHLIGQNLNIEGYKVAIYPISYTVGECLNDFCEVVEWELDKYTYSDYISGGGGTGAMIVERNSCLSPYRQTLRTAEQPYRQTLRTAEQRLIHGET